MIVWMLFSTICNALISFLTAWLLIELFVCFVRAPRARAYLRTIPILKLPLDIVCRDWSLWSIGSGIYPWMCPPGSRHLTVSCDFPLTKFSLGFFTQDNLSFTVADYAAYQLGFWPVCCGIALAIIAVFLCTLRKLMRAKVFPTYSPYVIGYFRPRIVFPKRVLETLTWRERKAVLAHEKAHVRFYDPLCKAVVEGICTLFAWVPTAWLRRRIALDLEMAADRRAHPIDLSRALCKIARLAKGEQETQQLTFFSRSTLRKRVEALCQKRPRHLLVEGVAVLAALYLSLGVLFGVLWTG